MKPIEILDMLKNAGLTVSLLHGDQIEVFPADKITSEIRNAIIYNKELIVRHVSTERPAPKESEIILPDAPKGQSWTKTKITETATPCRKPKRLPSPVALKWLLEHRQALDAAGWTREELYTRVKYKQGLAWLDLWEQAFALAYLHPDGTIEFECSVHGRDFIQTARPKRQGGKR